MSPAPTVHRDRILVTGAAGFLGANVVIALAQKGISVVAADRESPPPELLASLTASAEQIEWTRLDVRRSEDWATLPANGITAVIHAAAVTTGEDDPDPALTCDVNTGGTVKALEWAAKHGIRRFVYVSSSAVYRGTVTDQPLHEDLPLRPTTAYGRSKLAAEGFVELYGQTRGLQTVIARLPSLYGPWERPGEHRRNPSPVYQLVKAIKDSASPVCAAGADVGRDWTYVGDAAAGLVHLALLDEPPELVNLSWGRMVALRELAEVLEQVSGVPVQLKEGPACIRMTPTSGDQPMDVRALAAAGFVATTGPADGLRSYWEWLSDPRRPA